MSSAIGRRSLRGVTGQIQAILDGLLARTGASRVTLRRDDGFPVTDEALVPGVGSLRDERTIDLRGQPVAQEVAAGRQVVQHDSAVEYPDDAGFHRMREVYGGLASQIVTPVRAGGRVAAIVSVHDLRGPRRWTQDEIDACSDTAARIGELL